VICTTANADSLKSLCYAELIRKPELCLNPRIIPVVLPPWPGPYPTRAVTMNSGRHVVESSASVRERLRHLPATLPDRPVQFSQRQAALCRMFLCFP